MGSILGATVVTESSFERYRALIEEGIHTAIRDGYDVLDVKHAMAQCAEFPSGVVFSAVIVIGRKAGTHG